MKRFLSIFVPWLITLMVLTFFFASFFLNGQHPYRLPVLLAFVFSVLTYAFLKQSEKTEELEARIRELEEKIK